MSRLKLNILQKTAGILDEYSNEYANQNGRVTPYHILFKDHDMVLLFHFD